MCDLAGRQIQNPMKTNLLIPVVVLIAFACGKQREEQASENDSTNTTAMETAQADEGWILLFDGRTMNGWRTYKNKENDSWEIVDGTLHCKPGDAAKMRADLITVDQYDNFELSFEWKVAPKSNSGVMFRVTEDYEEPFFTGPEYQVLDDGGYPGETKEENFSGGNYDMHAPVNKRLNPVRQWNTSKILANGKHIEHWLNGDKVLEYEIGSEDWNNRKAKSKWKDVEGYAVPERGHIDLQDHGNEVWYRNIMIRKL
jgi:hypothetical protein